MPKVSGLALAIGVALGAAWSAWFPSGHGTLIALGMIAGGVFGWALGSTTIQSSQSEHPIWSGLLVPSFGALGGTLVHPGLIESLYNVAGEEGGASRLIFPFAITLSMLAALHVVVFIWWRLSDSVREQTPQPTPGVPASIGMGAAASFLAVIVVGGGIYYRVTSSADEAQLTQVQFAARLVASSLDGDALGSMDADNLGMDDPAVLKIQKRLRELRATLPGARFVYAAGLREGDFVYLVDSEPNNSSDRSRPGRIIRRDASNWINARAGQGYFGGPERDERGVWFTVLHPIWDSSRNSTSILGIDFPPEAWLRPLIRQRLIVMWGVFGAAALVIAWFAHKALSFESGLRISNLTDKLSQAMDAADLDGIDWYPSKALVVLGNRLAAKLGIGKGAVPISPRSLWKRVHPEDRPALAKRLRTSDVNKTGEVEVRLLDPAGQAKWVLLRGRLVTTPGLSETSHVAATVLNVHDSKHSRIETERQRRFAQQIMEAIPDGFAVLNPDGTIKMVNKSFAHKAMMAEVFLVGRQASTLFDFADTDEPNPESAEGMLKRGDGTSLPVRVRRAPLRESGRETGSILSLTDLTAARQAGQALLSSRAEVRRLSLIAKWTDEAVICTDSSGRIEWVNEGFTQLTGYSRAEVIGRTPGSFLQPNDFDVVAKRYMREQLDAGQGFETEVWNQTKQGVSYLVRIACHPVKDDAGAVVGFMAIERDVTRERKMESMLTDQRARVDALSRCLRSPGGDYGRNTAELLAVLVQSSGAARGIYCRKIGGEISLVAASGEGETPGPETTEGPIPALFLSQEPSLDVPDIAMSPYAFHCPGLAAAGYRSMRGRVVEVKGERLGVVLLYFGADHEAPQDFSTSFSLISRALVLEEVLARHQPLHSGQLGSPHAGTG